MKRKRKGIFFVILGGLALLTAGCGGPQNPLRFNGNSTSIVNGLWDGFTFPIVFVMDLFKTRDYSLYDHSHTDIYVVGYVVGILIFVSVLSWLLRTLRTLWR